MRNHLLALMVLFAATANAQNGTFTDLRLKKPGSAAGAYTFRTDAGGVLRSYNASGVETAAWNPETGGFSGAFSGTVPAANITAGTLGADVIVSDPDVPKLGVGGLLSVDMLAVDGSITANADVSVNGVVYGNSFVAGEAYGGFTGPSATISGEVSAGSFTGSGFGLYDLNADALDTGTVPVARLPSAIPATRIGSGLIDNTEFDYLNNVSSNIQTQLNSKAPTANPTFTGNGNYSVGSTGSIHNGDTASIYWDSAIAGGGGWAFQNVAAPAKIRADGSLLTNVPAGQLTGTVADARLSANVVRYNASSPLVFNAGELQLGGNGNWATNGGITVYDAPTVDTWRLSFNGVQNRWEFDRAANVYTAGNFIGGGSQLTGIPHFTGNNTWTGRQTFNGGIVHGTILSTGSGTPTHTITPGMAYIQFNLNVGSPTIDLSNASLPIGTELWGTIINSHASNQLTFDAGSGNNVHAPGFFGQTWAMNTALNTAHRWFKIVKLASTMWSIDTGAP